MDAQVEEPLTMLKACMNGHCILLNQEAEKVMA